MFRFGIIGSCLLAGLPFWLAPAADTDNQPEWFTGKVVPVADLVTPLGTKLDPDAAPHWLVLVTEEGRIYPLIKDDGCRMFFKDKRLLNRPVRLKARRLPGSELLKVYQVHGLVDGKLHDVYYWCGICFIKRYEMTDCECCGAPMELTIEPVRK
ncbi:MAG: hypothetical protein ACK4RK_13345 [Gemmataceae bacterium]